MIAFGWTWITWSLFISEIIKLPVGIWTPDVDIGELLGVLPLVNTLNLVLIIAIYGQWDMIRDRQST